MAPTLDPQSFDKSVPVLTSNFVDHFVRKDFEGWEGKDVGETEHDLRKTPDLAPVLLGKYFSHATSRGVRRKERCSHAQFVAFDLGQHKERRGRSSRLAE